MTADLHRLARRGLFTFTDDSPCEGVGLFPTCYMMGLLEDESNFVSKKPCNLLYHSVMGKMVSEFHSNRLFHRCSESVKWVKL